MGEKDSVCVCVCGIERCIKTHGEMRKERMIASKMRNNDPRRHSAGKQASVNIS